MKRGGKSPKPQDTIYWFFKSTFKVPMTKSDTGKPISEKQIDIFISDHNSNPAIPFQIHSSVRRLIWLGIFWHNTLETPERNRRQREEYDHWSLTSSIVCVWNAVNQVWAMYWIWIFRGPAMVFFRQSINPFVSLFSWEANVLHWGTEWLRCNTRVMSWLAS